MNEKREYNQIMIIVTKRFLEEPKKRGGPHDVSGDTESYVLLGSVFSFDALVLVSLHMN